ncbi:hypothetical protein MLC59_01860 [Marinobacter bryozoorum]|uniref:hypothetical protein n=1 Tax=Marinobacter bryozoorum TaxID=256324 RepID=UPI0020069BEF|nr:hypothetical protein [Marinobacter bryozoorum]MCK7542915.1 hypothetical protein [Marinobacter bryozoorum]
MTQAEQLTRFGEVAIFNHGNGWVCKCETFVTGEGVKVEIKSDHRHRTIEAAIQQCLDRCIACIEDLKSKAPTLEAIR